MKQYDFEYTDQRFLFILLASCFALFLGLLFAAVYFSAYLGIGPSVLLAAGIPILAFLMNKKKLKKEGSARLDSTAITFTLPDYTHTIAFTELQAYKVEHYNGTRLSLMLKDKTKFRLTANDNFTDSGRFEAFCDELEEALYRFSLTANTGLARQPSFFKQKWLPILLGTMTLALAWVVVQALLEGKTPPASLFVSIALFLSLWGAYFKVRKKSKGKMPQV
jgi:hypothetical protein